ncbi:hypothetical protein KI387_035375 [Taxus chinensis]|uniref:Histidine--tRNA ligase, cytoplasmic n=1 Tax=Taxus chinensis TaxID=29808 RepID=A0AA38FN69_TAXCH|nr:hypothetical protein KI387_035375 [Taxus chinensis]
MAAVVGGRGSALSAETIYNVAYGLSTLQLDSSALEKISKSSGRFSSSVQKITPPNKNENKENGPFLSKVEARAALVVLANKLLQSPARIRSIIPVFIEHILNKNIAVDLPFSDKAIARAVAEAIYSFNGDFTAVRVSKDDLWVTAEEMEVMECSFAATVGISALAVYSSLALSVIADAVAGLSCESVGINSQAFDLEPSSEGFSNKLETDVACDMRILLFGSKLVSPKHAGFDGDSAFFSIPFAHGCFREDVKLAQNKIRIEINSAVYGKNPSGAKQDLGEAMQLQALTKSILSIAMSLQAIGVNSFSRAALNLKIFNGLEADVKLSEEVLQNCRGTGDLKGRVELIFHKALMENNSNGVFVASQVFGLLQEARKILALEASCALSLLGLREKLVADGATEQKPPADKETTNGGCSAEENNLKPQENKGKQRGEKKRKGNQEIVLGKGTGTVRQLFIQIIQRRIELEKTPFNVYSSPEKSARELDTFFHPKDPELPMLLETMKIILESNETRRLPKIPKGTRDFKPEQMAIRERAFGIIAGVFKRHGAVALDTPVFELRETLMGKYGEDSKLIYDLADQGGEICSLRYDLTVPFARYLAMYNISNLKRYHIARVYRRDNPSKGRYREFYQCDFDIAGQHALMVPDFEVIKVLTELLDELDIGDYEVKLNHRKLLDGMLEICGVPQEKFRIICSAIDKLDKQPWEQVRKEMVEEKGLTPETADSIGSLVLKRGRPLEMLAELKQKDSCFLKHDGSVLALQELETLFTYLEHSNCLNKLSFDLSLARGLDYYTGVIYEAVFKGTTQVGSIAAGGRYDNLVGMFSGKQVPAVGVSLGIERVFTIMEQQEQDRQKVIRATQTEVLVVVLGDDMGVAIKLVSELWAGKLKAEFALTPIKKIGKQVQYALESGIPYMLIMGDNELQKGLVNLKDIQANQQEEVPRDKIVEELKKRLNASNHSDIYTVV